MTGPEHYNEAERLLMKAAEYILVEADEPRALVASAQAHAILSLAAATAATRRVYDGVTDLSGSAIELSDPTSGDLTWDEAIS